MFGITGSLISSERWPRTRGAINESGDLHQALELLHGIPVRNLPAWPPLVEFCAAIPDVQYLRDSVPSWLARRMLTGRLPDMVLAESWRGQQAADWPLRLFSVSARRSSKRSTAFRPTMRCRRGSASRVCVRPVPVGRARAGCLPPNSVVNCSWQCRERLRLTASSTLSKDATMSDGRAGPTSQWGAFIRILRQTSRRDTAMLVISMVLAGLTEGIGIMLLVPLIDLAVDGNGALPWPVSALRGLPIETLLLAFTVIVSLRAALLYSLSVQSAAVTANITTSLRERCFAALMAAEWRWLSGRRGSDADALVITNVARVSYGYQQVISLFAGLVSFVVWLTAAFALSWKLATAGVVTAVLLSIPLARHARGAARLGEALGAANRSLHARMQDGLACIRAAKIAGAQTEMSHAFADVVEDLRLERIRLARDGGRTLAALNIGGAAALALAFYVGLVVLALPLARMVPLALVFGRLVPLIGTLQQRHHQWSHALPALADVEKLLAEAARAAEPSPSPNRAPLRLRDAIVLNKVSVRYAGREAPALYAIDLRLPFGTITTVTGQSGAGKSTLADLLGGLIEPDDGSMTVDGVPILGPDRIHWRARVAYIEQSPFLFNATVRDNLLWGRPATDDRLLRNVLQLASASFVLDLPQGLDTIVGDRGVLFSGGERQRVAIARALLAEPQLLLVDEATSALDRQSEAAVNDTIASLRGRVTTVVFGHRLSVPVDNRIALAEGRIVAAPVPAA